MAAVSFAGIVAQGQLASGTRLSQDAQEFLQNVFIFGQDGSPTTPEGWEALRQAFREGTIQESDSAKQKYIESVQKIEMEGVPVLVAIPKRAIPARSDTVLCYLHGGAFSMGSPEHLFQVFSQVADETGLKTIAVDYRLAPEHRFPAGLNDCYAVYKALIQEGKQVIFIGDSAGGNLALEVALRAKKEKIKEPLAIVGFSPFVNTVKEEAGASWEKNQDPHIRWCTVESCVAGYAGDQNAAHPDISVLQADLSHLPPTLVLTGTRDALEDDCKAFAAKAASQGSQVELISFEGIWHAIVERGEDKIPEAGMVRRTASEFINHLF